MRTDFFPQDTRLPEDEDSTLASGYVLCAVAVCRAGAKKNLLSEYTWKAFGEGWEMTAACLLQRT